MIRIFADLTWDRLGLPGDPPIDTLMLNDAWRLQLDAEGLSIFYRAIAHEQPQSVQRIDLIQRVFGRRGSANSSYGGWTLLLEAAGTILHGHYPNPRAVHISELLT